MGELIGGCDSGLFVAFSSFLCAIVSEDVEETTEEPTGFSAEGSFLELLFSVLK